MAYDMTDPEAAGAAGTMTGRWRERLIRVRWLLAVCALLLGVFFVSGALSYWVALPVFAVLLAGVALVPLSPAGARAGSAAQQAGSEPQEVMFALADALPDPCLLIDSRAIVLHANAAARTQFPNIANGNPIAFAMRNPALLSAIESVCKGGGSVSVEFQLPVPKDVWFKATATALAGLPGVARTGVPDQVVVTMHNLTEQKRIDTMRGDFVANASHELRTPLASLMGFIETLQGPAARDPEAREKFLGIMRNQAQRMSNLIDDMLSLSRIELRQHVRPTGKVDIARLLREVREALQVQAEAAGVAVKLDVPGESAEVTGDREELYEVFQNLVDNAIKYGGENDTIEVTLAPAKRNGFAWQVSVTDHGEGIAEEHVPRLTERFYRVDAESSRKKKGTGLGLAIVKHILNRHGGELVIRSKLGQGTRVEILLPR